MNIRASRVLNTVAALCLVAVFILVIPSFFNPEFEVVNNSSETVSASAVWQNNEKEIGSIPPGTARRFSVSDEAAMTFRIFFAKGKVIESEPIYFTRGIKIIATISNDGVEVRYDFET